MNAILPHPPATTAPSTYAAFGLVLHSDFALPGLQHDAGTDGPEVWFVRRPPGPAPADSFGFRDDGDTMHLWWSEVGSFTIVSSNRVEVAPNPGVADDLVALPLLGAVLAALLHRRGMYVLHASAVSINGRGAVLCGDKGAGKSTTAAVLAASGHRLIADDIVALDFADGGPRILPAGSAEMKLWSETVAALPQLDIGAGRSWHTGINKASYPLRAAPASEPTPLGAVYVLSRSDTPTITAFDPPQALALLLRFSYQARYGQAGFGATLGTHFERSGRLAHDGLVRNLQVPHGLERVGDIVSLVEADMGAR